jgi:hypothetical protein
MKKVLVAVHYNEIKYGTPDVGCLLTRLAQLKLTGVFIHNVQVPAVPESVPLPQISHNKSHKGKTNNRK